MDAQALALPVILVVGLRLGCINHALLTAEALRARGLHLAGWVANTVDADMPYLADNLAPYKRPSRVLAMETFPMTLSGKILKRSLLQQLQS